MPFWNTILADIKFQVGLFLVIITKSEYISKSNIYMCHKKNFENVTLSSLKVFCELRYSGIISSFPRCLMFLVSGPQRD